LLTKGQVLKGNRVILSRVPRQNQPTGPADRVVAKDTIHAPQVGHAEFLRITVGIKEPKYDA
jgi:hypothetical protein